MDFWNNHMLLLIRLCSLIGTISGVLWAIHIVKDDCPPDVCKPAAAIFHFIFMFIISGLIAGVLIGICLPFVCAFIYYLVFGN